MKSSTILNTKQQRLAGFTLVELLVSVLIGLIILGAVLGIFVSMIKSDNENLKSIRLNQELRAAMSLMTRDIRRAGANRNAATNAATLPPTNPFSSTSTANTATTATRLVISGGGNTISYSYDEASDGTTELYGFRLNTTTDTERVEQCKGSTSVSAGCGTWQPVTDESLVRITGLTFTDTTVVEAGINVRQIRISLSGVLRRDTTVSRTITETVKIRNDEF